jgi:hypothetical protein
VVQHLGRGLVAFWLALLFLMMLGFSYSFFWSAATVIYFLMRRKVDEAEPDEVFLEDPEPEAPLAPPKIADGTAPIDQLHRRPLPVISPPPGTGDATGPTEDRPAADPALDQPASCTSASSRAPSNRAVHRSVGP